MSYIDEEVSYISVNGVEYDDYIFILSAIYAANIGGKVWAKRLEEEPKLWKELLFFAPVIHCMDWRDAIEDVIDLADLEHVPYDRSRFKSHYESRNYVIEHITPILMEEFRVCNEIRLPTIISVLSEI